MAAAILATAPGAGSTCRGAGQHLSFHRPAAVTAVALFVKTPGLSPVKTRLARGIGDAAATTFHRLAADCAGAAAAACGPAMPSIWAVAEPDGLVAWCDRPALWQGEGGLGARMSRIYLALLERHGQVLLIGADSPQVTPGLLRHAAGMLERGGPFVLGPAHDGGFWLFGGRVPLPPSLWDGVTYSAPSTGRDFLAALQPHGACPIIDGLLDVDTASDLPDLLAALLALPAPSLPQKRLTAWLTALIGPC